MRKVLRLKIVFVLLLFSGAVWAQTRTVWGKGISTDEGTAVPGVNVIQKGTTNGTSTDADGNFTLVVPNDATLIFSFIGFETKEVAVGDQAVINVSLGADAKQLSEVVVVGYGTQSKRDLTGSVSSISGDKIKLTPVQSFDQGLAGETSGENVTSPNGVMGHTP